jgi:hypothetical protein
VRVDPFEQTKRCAARTAALRARLKRLVCSNGKMLERLSVLTKDTTFGSDFLLLALVTEPHPAGA